MVATPISVAPLETGAPTGSEAPAVARDGDHEGLLDGLRVLDFSAFVAGPLGAQVLADLGADVIKVEPPEGEAMRAAAYAVAACQRGKRSVAIDINAPEARPVVERLIKWADVVLHNFRVGVSERLGIDEQTVAHLNPRAVYCHASGFGTTGRRAAFPSNDALMQAVTGLERAVGGVGNDPLAPTWIPIDMAGGWVTATGILAGLYVRATSGRGQQVATSLLGAGMLLQSGVFERDGSSVRGPELDAQQTGYGPGYRIYECGDGNWLALVLPDRESWLRLRGLARGRLTPVDLRAVARRPRRRAGARSGGDPRADVRDRTRVRLGRDDCRIVELLAAAIAPMSRDEFRRAMLDDPVNRQLGRVVTFETADWGRFEQIGPLLRSGPPSGDGPALVLPGIGEHTAEVLAELGFSGQEIDGLLGAEVARQL